MRQARGLVMAVAILAGTGAGAQAASISTVSGSGFDVWTYDAVLYDLSTVPNLVFTQGGATIDARDGQQAVSSGQFGAQSIYDDEMVSFWSAGSTSGGPMAAAMAAAVPEAGSLTMLGLGLLGAGITARRRQQRS